jgi:hypothetical protein
VFQRTIQVFSEAGTLIVALILENLISEVLVLLLFLHEFIEFVLVGPQSVGQSNWIDHVYVIVFLGKTDGDIVYMKTSFRVKLSNCIFIERLLFYFRFILINLICTDRSLSSVS